MTQPDILPPVPSPAEPAAQLPRQSEAKKWHNLKLKVRGLHARVRDLVEQRERLRRSRDQARRALAEAEADRDRARATAVDLEQQLEAIRAGLAADAAEIRSFPERHTFGSYEHGQYDHAVHALACVLATTGEHYPGLDEYEAAAELARALDEGDLDHAGRLPIALDLDVEARRAAHADLMQTITDHAMGSDR